MCLRGVVNDALAIYFLDTALANAFVARWCMGYRAETIEGSFRLRDDEPAPRVPRSAPPDAVRQGPAPDLKSAAHGCLLEGCGAGEARRKISNCSRAISRRP